MRLTLLLIALVAPPAWADHHAAASDDDTTATIPTTLRERAALQPITTHAKNVIIFIGDGMGVTTVTAGRIFAGQQLGLDGESHELALESLPYTALVKTYNTNQQVPDSAGTASAMFTGVKTRAGVISVGPQAERRDCEDALAHPLTTVWEVAEARGLATG
ncbi:MAG: alkaline phosphatase, partial [Pseudomonadota bacterium]